LGILLVGFVLIRGIWIGRARAEHRKAGGEFAPVEARLVLEFPEILRESSGLAVSALVPGLYWTHNDSGDGPVVYGVTADGLVSQVTLTGAGAQDWESMDQGPCPWNVSTSCLYIADMGDNLGTRSNIVMYIFEEALALADGGVKALGQIEEATVESPLAADGSVAVSGWRRLVLRYPEGARDAEALAVDQNGVITIVSKGREGAHNVFRISANAILEAVGETGAVAAEGRILASVGQIPLEVQWWVGRMVTGGSWDLEGDLVLRTYTEILEYRERDGEWVRVGDSCFVGRLGGGGEAITVLSNGHFMLTREASGNKPAGMDEVTCPESVPLPGM